MKMPPKRSPKRKAAKSPRKGSRRSGKKQPVTATPTTMTFNRVLGGVEDVETIDMAWETIFSTTLALSTDFVVAVQGNSIYQPGGIATYGMGLTTNPGGYARMYTQYKYAEVLGSSIKVQAWATSGTIAGGIPTAVQAPIPLRLAVVPAQATAGAAYAGQNVASMGSYPHAKVFFAQPGAYAQLSHSATTAQMLTAGHTPLAEEVTVYSASTGVAASAQWWWMIGVTNASGILNATNIEVRYAVKYRVKWYTLVAASIMLEKDRFGNESSSASEVKRIEHSSATETKSTLASMRASRTSGENATVAPVESKGDTKSAHVKGFACGLDCPQHPTARSATARAAYEDDLVDFPGMDSDEEEAFYAWRESIRRNAHADNAGPSWAKLKSSEKQKASVASPLKVAQQKPAAPPEGPG